MSQRRRTRASSQKSKQRTLLSYLSSSPPSSPSKLFPESPVEPGPSKRKRTRKTSSSSSSHPERFNDADSDVGAIRFESEAIDISDEDHSPRRPNNKRHKGLVGVHAIPIRTTSDDSLEETPTAPRNRKARNKTILDSDDDARPRKRKLIKGIRPPTPEEDDDDILDAENRE